ncbi:hypothetical protein [Nostoc sp.]
MKHLLTIQKNLITVGSQDHISIEISQSLKAKYTCLCCSNALLRHVHSGVIYWRCSYCYQEMPVEKTTRVKMKNVSISDHPLICDLKFVVLPN